jgi:HEAT repeat protein
MSLPTLPAPGLLDLEEAAKKFLRGFDRRRFIYISPSGEWKENPKTLRDTASHELLFELAKLQSGGLRPAITNIFFPLAGEHTWPLCLKIWQALIKSGKGNSGRRPGPLDEDNGKSGFLILLEVLAWKVGFEALRLNSECHVPAWDNEANRQKLECLGRLKTRERYLDRTFTAAERSAFTAALEGIRKSSPPIIDTISRFLAEEEKFSQAISELLRKARQAGLGDEALPLIAEKIQPPEGIVTNTSPALVRPCLRLLVEEDLDILSGVPYYASMILSILKDPRSAEGLLKALKTYPVTSTKIRENIIYALGHLREDRAVDDIAAVLERPDEILEPSAAGEKSYHPLMEQKEEAIWALGRIGFPAVKKLPELARYADHSSLKLRTYLAWTLGEIGKTQKEKLGGVSADIVIALLKLLKTKNKQVFEESVSALKKIGMPEFIHSLYLYHAGAISILGLKPAQRGLYELSETLHYLIQSKKRTIMAVNGDSGTGKTYFCHAIRGGFGEVKPEEILYLMRDRKRGQKVFNRLLGIQWLKKYIDPAYYHDYPLAEEQDNPDEYFRQFLAENADKKLIILDGARDSLYFQKVIDYFYVKGELDVEVNFRANYSTRRLNLEEREMALESVKTHLAFLEEPTLEDTLFYQEGVVVLYDLDNSVGSRLNAQETKELFETRRIDSWGDLIRLGDFKQEPRALKANRTAIACRDKDFALKRRTWKPGPPRSFVPDERNFKAVANENPKAAPNLLLHIDLGDLRAEQIRFYAQDQIAGFGEKGEAFILTFLDNRIFETALGHLSGIALLGRNIYVVNDGRELVRVSFERNEITPIAETDSPILRIASLPRQTIVTGHADGGIRVWDVSTQEVRTIEADGGPIRALAVDYDGRVYSSNKSGGLRRWSLETKTVTVADADSMANVSHIKLYPFGKILCLGTSPGQVAESPSFNIVDFDKRELDRISTEFKEKVTGLNVYFDGRIIAGFSSPEDAEEKRGENLIIISAIYEDASCAAPTAAPVYKILGGHALEAKDCLIMGPKIVSCGSEAPERPSLRIWGTEFFVRMELGKLAIQKGSDR